MRLNVLSLAAGLLGLTALAHPAVAGPYCGAGSFPAQAGCADQCCMPPVQYKVCYATVIEECPKVCYRPVYQTVMKECRYTVCKPCYEQHLHRSATPSANRSAKPTKSSVLTPSASRCTRPVTRPPATRSTSRACRSTRCRTITAPTSRATPSTCARKCTRRTRPACRNTRCRTTRAPTSRTMRSTSGRSATRSTNRATRNTRCRSITAPTSRATHSTSRRSATRSITRGPGIPGADVLLHLQAVLHAARQDAVLHGLQAVLPGIPGAGPLGDLPPGAHDPHLLHYRDSLQDGGGAPADDPEVLHLRAGVDGKDHRDQHGRLARGAVLHPRADHQQVLPVAGPLGVRCLLLQAVLCAWPGGEHAGAVPRPDGSASKYLVPRQECRTISAAIT